MSWDVCTVTYPIARKEYRCDACELINSYGLMEADFTPEEWQIIQKAKSEGNKIIPGTKYAKTKGIWEGGAGVFRARIDINNICLDNDLYEEY